nr:MAG TPA: hypothetical protein [Caudoviricetes sp.]
MNSCFFINSALRPSQVYRIVKKRGSSPEASTLQNLTGTAG